MKNKGTICHYTKGKHEGCKECGSFTVSTKPCHVEIPDHIPLKQINKFVRIKLRRINV